jgi:hypothetical protein
MAKKEFALGLPDPTRFGRVTDLPIGKPLEWVIQEHKARRAGKHYDIRLGPQEGSKPTLLSWAARKLPIESGQKTLAFQQPLHTGAYADFQGTIVSGYGAGTVKTHDRGKVIVTSVSPDKLKFAVIHKKAPETFVLLRQSGPPVNPKTARTARTQGGSWLLINTTPTDAIKHNKVHYAKVPAADVHKMFDAEYLAQEKIDGAAAFYQLFSDRIEALSYRPTTKGRPIIHTYRVGGLTGVNIPKHLVGTILRGELYGVRKGTDKAIPPQELGGILNASTLKALQKKQEQKVELRSAVFDILRYGKKKEIPLETPLAERMRLLQEVMPHLPKDKFHLPEAAETPAAQAKLWERISTGKHPLTHEGMVFWPKAGGKPVKVKLYQDEDVYVTSIFPGAGRLEGVGAGGFKYSLKPGGSEVGEVGTGFTEETRRQMFEHPEEFVGRVARIKAQEQFPSGAYRAPAFIALHEDYPGVQKAAMYLRSLLKSGNIRAREQTMSGELTRRIGLVVQASGGTGNTLADLVKVAGVPPIEVPELSPELAKALAANKTRPPALGDVVRAKLLGMQPSEVGYLRTGLSGVAKTVETIKSLADQLKRQMPAQAVE